MHAGYWKNDMKHGHFIFVEKDGSKQKENWEDDQFIGFPDVFEEEDE